MKRFKLRAQRSETGGQRTGISLRMSVFWSLASVLCVLTAGQAAETNSPATRAAAARAALLATPIPRSVFVLPKSRVEGVDPFFPLSTRLAAASHDSVTNRPAALVKLTVKGFSVSAASPLVTINDTTFAPGDERVVTTTEGRARVRCVEIRVQEE